MDRITADRRESRMKPLGDIDPASARRTPPPVSPAVLAKAEAVATQDMTLRGCPPDVADATAANWRVKKKTRGATGAATLEDCPWLPMLDRWPAGVVDEAGNHPKFLMLYGPVGSGKSHGAAWIMRRYLAANLHRIEATDPDGNVVFSRTAASAIWIDVALTMKKILQAFKDKTEEVWPRMDYDFTVLDDLGATQPTEYQDQVTNDWVRELYSSPGYTVVTTNLTPEQWRDAHPRSASRIMSGPVLEMNGSDARRKQWRFA